MAAIRISYHGGDVLTVGIRDHGLVADQPIDHGGTDMGPTPTELFVASLAACVGFFGQRYMRRHDVDPAGFEIACSFTLDEKPPGRVTDIDLRLTLPPWFPEELEKPFLRTVQHCTVHESITRPPRLRFDVTRAPAAAPVPRA